MLPAVSEHRLHHLSLLVSGDRRGQVHLLTERSQLALLQQAQHFSCVCQTGFWSSTHKYYIQQLGAEVCKNTNSALLSNAPFICSVTCIVQGFIGGGGGGEPGKSPPPPPKGQFSPQKILATLLIIITLKTCSSINLQVLKCCNFEHKCWVVG